MKRVVSLLLAFALALSLAGCKKDANQGLSDTLSINSDFSQTTTPSTNDEESNNQTTSSENIENVESTETANSSEIQANKPTHKHSYVSKVIKNATCTGNGTKTFTCSCGNNYSEVIAALGHSWGEWQTASEATNYSEGKAIRFCNNCGADDSKVLPKLPTQKAVVTPEQLKRINEGFLMLVNAERANLGVQALTANPYLNSVAKIRSDEIIQSFSHTRPNGESFYSVVDGSKYSYVALAENIVMTSHVGNNIITAEDAWIGSDAQIESAYSWIFYLFKNSPGHYSNMINGEYKDTGIGISYTVDEKSNIPMFYLAHIFGVQ